MASTFIYSIAQDIPGGVFDSDISSRLYLLITENITTQLLEISSESSGGGGTLTVRFITDLSAKDKTALDGDTLNPAGGFVGRSSDFIELTHNAQVINEYDRLLLTADGIQSATIDSQLKDGNGVAFKGETEQQVFAPDGLAPVNKSKDNLDGSGAASFVLGPSFNRGVVYVTVSTKNLPDRNFEVQFE